MKAISSAFQIALLAAFILHRCRLLKRVILGGCLAALGSSFILAQGSLTPPGAPAPTMKTLQQIEPRIDLQNALAAAVDTSNASYHFIINQPGSYYLSANLGVTKTNGIQINAEGVTLDLNGFQISRASGTGGNGIEIPDTSHRASILHGSIKGFAYGVRSLVSSSYAQACGFRDLAVSNCTTYGILAGEGAVLEACRAHGNTGTAGIKAHFGSSLTNCTKTYNTVTYGIIAEKGSAMTHCSAFFNTVTYGIVGDDGSSLTNCSAFLTTATHGIYANAGSSLTNCTASTNTSGTPTSAGIGTGNGCTITHCTAFANSTTASASITTGMGIDVGTGVIIKDCTTTNNQADGIRVASSCIVAGCTSSLNGVSSLLGDGIRTTGDNNRIDGNLVVGNGQYGIRTVGTSIVVRNSATGNATANYNVNSGTNIGPIQIPSTATSPWANF